MPAFKQHGEQLAQGMAMLHGYAPKSEPFKPVDQELAKVGRKLISSEGGLSCVACHAVGTFGATQVFETAGINFVYATDRLRHDFFVRWLRNPLTIDPQTKMPVFFDEEGKSPLGDVLEGDALKQIDAIWEYFLLKEKMPPPGEAGQ
jgi:cytochrome c peroxidase